MFTQGQEQAYNPGVFVSHLDTLRRQKASKEDRNITLRTIAEETGIALSTVHRVKQGPVDKIQLKTINMLCHYFGVATLDAIISFVPDEETAAKLQSIKDAPHQEQPDRTDDTRAEYRVGQE